VILTSIQASLKTSTFILSQDFMFSSGFIVKLLNFGQAVTTSKVISLLVQIIFSSPSSKKACNIFVQSGILEISV
jgi:hypothetical protein